VFAHKFMGKNKHKSIPRNDDQKGFKIKVKHMNPNPKFSAIFCQIPVKFRQFLRKRLRAFAVNDVLNLFHKSIA